MPPPRSLTWLAPGEPFPPVHHTWGVRDPIPGLLAAGGALDTPTLLQAYRHGIFPWFSEDQPILWWSPDPRMVLRPEAFRLHPSLRKTLRAQLRNGTLEVRMDTAFDAVISACAQTPRKNQNGTWIVASMVDAYRQLHLDGHAHSVETWWNGELAGGLYTVNVGRMVFGESMFSRRTDASKIALAALVACCLQWRVPAIDCQQNTPHLASLGAREMPRADFVQVIEKAIAEPSPVWQFDPVYWNSLLS